MTDDIQLVEAARRGDRQSQEMLYNRFAKKMFGVCLGYSRNREDAQDLLQEGFVKVFAKIGQYNGDGPLENWIRRIIVNTAIDAHRKSFTIPLTSIDFVPEDDVPVDTGLIDLIDSQNFLAIIQSLPRSSRLIFNLYAVEGYKHREIADMLGISEGTSKSQVHEAKRILRKKLKKLYGYSDSYYEAALALKVV